MTKTVSIEDRHRAVQIVEAFSAGGYSTEAEDDQRLEELLALTGNEDIVNYLFWGPNGPDNPEFENLSAEQIVDEAIAPKTVILLSEDKP